MWLQNVLFIAQILYFVLNATQFSFSSDVSKFRNLSVVKLGISSVEIMRK
jgi:hypothetical protein